MVFKGHIVLIGPMGVGKTPVAEMIASKLNIEHVRFDTEQREDFGYSYQKDYEIQGQGDYIRLIQYLNQFTIPMIARYIEKHQSAVLDCGGSDLVGTTYQERQDMMTALKKLNLNHTAALIPFETVEETRVFYKRSGPFSSLDEYFIQNPSYSLIADRVFYTHGDRLEKVAAEIIKWVGS